MFIVLKIISGEEVVGQIPQENTAEIADLEYFEVINPMWIVAERGGSMKLRDATMLSADKALIFYTENVITCYIPTETLVEYYKAASEYNNITRTDIDKQIAMATEELQQSMKEAEDLQENITRFALKASKTSIH